MFFIFLSVQFFEKGGAGEKIFLLRKFSPPHKYTILNLSFIKSEIFALDVVGKRMALDLFIGIFGNFLVELNEIGDALMLRKMGIDLGYNRRKLFADHGA